MSYDVIIIGSGAGGCAAAYHLTQTGRRVLLLEKGMALPGDGSTLDPDQVLGRGAFLSDEPWIDRDGRITVPEEHFNLGGKTKWYGAALLRFAPHEFARGSRRTNACAWPFGYDELAPFYDEAERLLGVRQFAVEANLQALVAGLRRQDPHWRRQPMSLGLAPDILSFPEEARHFDAFASVRGLKSDAEIALLSRVRRKPNLEILTGHAVRRLLPGRRRCQTRRRGRMRGRQPPRGRLVVLAAGALHSPRLLQTYLERSGLSASAAVLRPGRPQLQVPRADRDARPVAPRR